MVDKKEPKLKTILRGLDKEDLVEMCYESLTLSLKYAVKLDLSYTVNKVKVE